MWWVNCHHFGLLILRMRFVCFRFCLLCSKLESPVGHLSVRKPESRRNFLHQKMENGRLYYWEFRAVVPIRILLSVWGQSRRLKKELDESCGIYESTVGPKPNSNRSYQKRTPEFVVEVLTMIETNPSTSIRFITRDMEVSELLIRQVVHQGILYFSCKMRQGHSLSLAMKVNWKDLTAKLLNKLKHLLYPNRICFSQMRKNFCQDQMGNSENNS